MTSSCELVTSTEETLLGVQAQLIELFCSKGRRVIVLSGPTGVGKTNISIPLAQLLGGEIISADSMHVYRGMDIGTAKVSKEDREKVPHHLVDIRDIHEPFNVYDFFQEARAALEDILARKRVPIIVGGTGFYIHSMIYGPPGGPPSNPEVRQRLEEEAETLGIDHLYERLKGQDPFYASTITPNDQHKIIRALEIVEVSNKKVSDFSWKTRHPIPGYDFRCWFLYGPRPWLYERLSARCDQMLEEGLLHEVVELDKAGIRQNRTASQAIGYRQTLDFLETAQTEAHYKAFVEKFRQASHHLAKRQCTWFRKESLFRWIDVTTMTREELIQWIAEDYSSAIPLAPPST